MNPRAIIGERGFHRLFHLTDVGAMLHVDKVNHDQPGHIAQAQLPRDFLSGFQICANRRLFDPIFPG